MNIFIEDTPLIVNDGAYEGFLKLTDAIKARQFVMIKAFDKNGLLGQELLSLDHLLEADKIIAIEENYKSESTYVKAKTNATLKLDATVLKINDSALIEDREISISKLRKVDIAPLSSGLINVTNGGIAYRFLPDGTKFNNPVSIEIGYDENLLPKGHTVNEIKTFYFNTKTKEWTVIERDTINKNEKTITSLTNHFTDYINGIIQTPESPETAGFTPTMMSDIKAVDPSSEMTLISPPEVSQKGDANVSYPIKIPAGRKGMQPQLAVQYSNEGGNGWLGQGWNISTPSISIDTKWGVPLLDPESESEIYMLNGEQLMYENILNSEGNYVNWMPNRHYDATSSSTTNFSTVQRQRMTDAVFTPRKQGSFSKIVRIGTNTTNYYWKVTNSDGTIYWYGGKNGVVENTVINGTHGSIVHWGLYMVEDIHGNTIKYIYENSEIVGLTGVNSNLNQGKIFNVKNIYYTGEGDAKYGYQIDFNNSASFREDISINGRLGLKQIEPYFLNNITIKKFGATENIRKYNFTVGYGKFKKGRLESVGELDKNDSIFYTHTFEYYDDLIQEGGQDIYFSSGITQTICNETPLPCLDTDNDGVCNDVDNCVEIPGPSSNNGCPDNENNCYEVYFNLPLVNKLYGYIARFENQTIGNCEFTPYRVKEFTFQGTTLSPSPPLYLSFFNPVTNSIYDYCDPSMSSFGTVYDYSTANPNFNNQFQTWLNTDFFSSADVFDLNINSESNFNCVGCAFSPISTTRVTNRMLSIAFKSYNDSYTGNLKLEYSTNNTGTYLQDNNISSLSRSIISANELPSLIEINGVPLSPSYYNFNSDLSTFINDFQNQYGEQAIIQPTGYTGDQNTIASFYIQVPNSETVLSSIKIGDITYPFTQCVRNQKSVVNTKSSTFSRLGFLNNFSFNYSGLFGDPDCPSIYNADFLIQGNIPSFNSTGAFLGSSTSDNYSIGGQLGIGIGWKTINKMVTIGKKYSHSWEDGKSLSSLIDINGDGLDDLVIKSGGNILWKKHVVSRTYNSLNEPIVTHSFETPYALITSIHDDIKEFYKSDGESSSWDTEINIGFSGANGFVGWEKSKNKSKTTVYFTDANADGLIDIVKRGTVYFNRIDSSGNPYFEPESKNTENMLIVAAPVTITPPVEEENIVVPNYDVVKVWEAPADGTIKIENTIVNTNPSEDVVVSVEMKRNEIISPPSTCYEIILPLDQNALSNKIYRYRGVTSFLKYVNNDCKYIPYKINNFSINGINHLTPPNLFTNHYQSSVITNMCGETSSQNTNFATQFTNFLNSNFSSIASDFSTSNMIEYGSSYGVPTYSYGGHFSFTSSTLISNFSSQGEGINVIEYPYTIQNGHMEKHWRAAKNINPIYLNGNPLINPADGSTIFDVLVSPGSSLLRDAVTAQIGECNAFGYYTHIYSINTYLPDPFLKIRICNPITIPISMGFNGNIYYFNLLNEEQKISNSLIDNAHLIGDTESKFKEINNFSRNITQTINQTTCTEAPDELCMLFGTQLNTSNPFVNNIITTNCEGNTLNVKKGERIYFRTHSSTNGNPKVNWNPKVSYTNSSMLTTLDQNGLKPFESSYSDGFILSQDVPTVFPSNDGGTVEITWDPLIVNNPTDDITYEIINRIADESSSTDTVVFSQTVIANTTSTLITPTSSLNSISIGNSTQSQTNQFLFKVTSKSNVNWKAFEWKPRIICSTPQDVVATAGGSSEGVITVSETKYPIVNYSIYKPYNCGKKYQTINISSIGSGLGLNITPTIPSSLFASTDNGVVNFVVKRNNQLIGSRTITVTDGNVTISPAGSFPLGTGPSNMIEIGFYTDDSGRAINSPTDVSLLNKILNSTNVATISDGTTNTSISINEVNLYHKPIGLFGPMYRQWGQFLYNPANVTGAISVPSLGINLIKEESLTITDAQAQAIQNALVNSDNSANSTLTNLANTDLSTADLDALEASLDSVAESAGYSNFSFMTANPKRDFENNQYIEKWIGLHDENYASALYSRTATMAQSFSFEEDSTITVATSNTGAHGINKISKGSGRSFSGGGGYGGFNASGSISNGGESKYLTDYIDLNGDRYPDIVTESQVQFTLKTGGLFSPITRTSPNNGFMSIDKNSNWGFSASGTFSKSGKSNTAASGAMPASNGKLKIGKLITASYSDPQGSACLSGNFGQGDTNTSKLWADINGDGLADIITRNNSSGEVSINLNIGRIDYNNNNQWGSFTLASGKSTSYGGGVGYNYANGSISGGVSLGGSDSDTQNNLIDINGDGLIDKVSSNSSSISVDFNRGNKFVNSPNIISNYFNFYNNSATVNASANLGGTYSAIYPLFLFTIVIPLKIPDVNGSVSAGTSVNRTKKSFVDFDGDGYQDFVEELSSNTVRVHHSRIRRTDMLKSVTNPLGGKFTIDYKVQAVNYNNPHAKWAMSDVIIEDKFNTINDGFDTIKKHFIYEDGKYDRREREFYGYKTVKTEEYTLDDSGEPILYRTAVSNYHNKSYFLSGLLEDSYIIKEGDLTKKFSKTKNYYEIFGLTYSNNEIDLSSTQDFSFDVGGREGRRTAAVLLTKTINEFYELSTSPLITTEVNLGYDSKGRIVSYISDGNVADSTDDYSSIIEYHDTMDALNIINVPKSIKVNNLAGVTLRERRTVVDSSNGNITTIAAKNNTTWLETNMEYDIYGNLKQINYPVNSNGESMFYTYDYDSDYNKYIVQIKDAFGYVSTASYNSNFDKIVETTDLTGNQMLYSYDNFGRSTTILGPKEIAEGKPYTIRFNYYPYLSSLPSSAGATADNFVPVAVTSHYDQQHPTNDIQTFTFIDGLARPIQVKKDIHINKGTVTSPNFVEALSVSGKSYYDEFGRVTKQFHPHWEVKDTSTMFLLNEYDSPYISTTQYDVLDRPVKSVDPEGNISTVKYSIAADVEGVVAFKTKTDVEQNASQHIITETFKDVSGKVISTKNEGGTTGSIWTKFKYNSIGELFSYTDAQNISTTYKYDMLGRKTKVTHPDNGTTKFNYDNVNLVSLQTANLGGVGTTIDYKYNYSRLLEIIYPITPDGNTNIANVSYKYGDSGNQTGRLIWQKDATGTQEFDYGNMGEMIANSRTVVGPNIPTRVFKTQFNYDSWNRLQEMQYPDGEKVSYTYDLGGNLNRVSGFYNDTPYDYIKRIDYDHYEQRSYLQYGNNTETFYKYTPSLRRLENLNVKTSDNHDLFNNKYGYDKVGNILGVENTVPVTANNMAGKYLHKYSYDKLNRLVSAQGSFDGSMEQIGLGNDANSNYTLKMEYNNTHGITKKEQKHIKNGNAFVENCYSNKYTYHENTHKIKAISDASSTNYENFFYDLNGNIVYRETNNSSRRFAWDESNRLRVVTDSHDMQHYIYDASGERVLKASSDTEAIFENGTLLTPETVVINGYTSYPSAFIVITADGVYSKHYYAGSQRIVSRLGDDDASIFETCEGCKEASTKNSFDPKKLQQDQKTDLQAYADQLKKGKITYKDYKPIPLADQQQAIDEENKEDDSTKPVAAKAPTIAPMYFYHPDHLGTNTALTDFNGNAYQFFINLPFGETMAQQLGSNYYTSPYKFNGKELDEETGFYYYGARYYDPRISVWMSVDPLAEKYPNISPYAYCANNPIFYKDPDGREIIIYYMDRGKERSYSYSYEKGRKISSIDNNKFLRNSVKMLDKLVSTGATRDLQVSGDKGQNCGDRILQAVNDPRPLAMIEGKNKEKVSSRFIPNTYTGEGKAKIYGNKNGLGTISVNDEYGVQVNLSSGKNETNSPTAQLGHEIIHQQHFVNDFDRYDKERTGLMKEENRGGTPEERLTTQESNQINGALNEPLRNDYSGTNVKMDDPTINKKSP